MSKERTTKERKTAKVYIRITEEEHTTWHAAAKARGVSVAELVRSSKNLVQGEPLALPVLPGSPVKGMIISATPDQATVWKATSNFCGLSVSEYLRQRVALALMEVTQ